jgi:hypothetical protein
MKVADDDSCLNDHDWRAIAEIQRELDAEFGPREPGTAGWGAASVAAAGAAAAGAVASPIPVKPTQGP